MAAVAFAAVCYPGYALLYQAVAALRNGPRVPLWVALLAARVIHRLPHELAAAAGPDVYA